MTDARIEILETFRKSEKEMTESLWQLENVLTATPYLVRCEGVCLMFDVDPAFRVSNPTPTTPHRARRFSKRDAEAVAANVVNGRGVQAEAVLVIDAIRDELANVRDLIAKIEE